jgi:hypothetical protein
MLSLHLTRILGAHNIRVIELADRPHFALETADCLPVLHSLLRQHLNGHAAIERDMDRLVNHTHTTVPQLTDQTVISQVPEVQLRLLKSWIWFVGVTQSINKRVWSLVQIVQVGQACTTLSQVERNKFGIDFIQPAQGVVGEALGIWTGLGLR